MKTFLPKIDMQRRKWRIIDADGQVLGVVAEKAANILRGRDKPTYTPHMDTGDFVVVINAEKVRVTGRKETNKVYTRFSGWRGGQKRETVADVRAKHPERLIMRAVKACSPRIGLAQNAHQAEGARRHRSPARSATARNGYP